MKLGICATQESLAEAAAAGFEFAEMSVGALAPDQDETAFAARRAALLAAPIRVEAFNCFIGLRVTGPEVDLAAVGRYMELVLRRASEVGAVIMVFGSAGARRLPEGFPVERGWSQLAEAARLAAEIAERHGMTVAMEPVLQRACNFFNRVEQGVAFVDRVGHPRLRLLADMFHMEKEGEPVANLAAAGKRLAHIHLATPSLPETAPGPAYDFSGFFAALRQASYAGRVSVEDNPGLLAQSKLPRVDAFRAVREYLAPFCRA